MTTDASTPISNVQQLIDSFNAIFAEPAPRFSMFAAGTQALQRIYIPGYVTPIYTPGAQVGVNKDMVNSVRGLLCVVQPYDQMKAGDAIEVFFGDPRVAAVRFSVLADQVGNNIEFYIPAKKVLAGIRDLFFVVTRAGATNKETSLTLKVLVRLVAPGGNDPQPDRPGHYNLLPPQLVNPPADKIVHEEDFQEIVGEDGEPALGMNVIVPAYPNMRAYDTIQFSWGGGVCRAHGTAWRRRHGYRDRRQRGQDPRGGRQRRDGTGLPHL
ncbi:hypothetical protein [Pseudomonas aegrilactucae]|uniref:Uncharacterized protein n=1 Tax=Pseudomonas aegrilactucae TaxID=2854028 RepID=A0A9Q3ACQ8_9PSED|nr:hypothetical protein [Pseudomonas aegrilactucae]MBV6286143.1 hypothetical protein [Pseudomonas aegrilactucae]